MLISDNFYLVNMKTEILKNFRISIGKHKLNFAT